MDNCFGDAEIALPYNRGGFHQLVGRGEDAAVGCAAVSLHLKPGREESLPE